MTKAGSQPLFSIITATFNSARTLQDTLNSLLAQQEKDWEWIVQDGGSQDHTLRLLEKIAVAKYVSQQDSGLYNAMNLGIERAQGEIIGILNSDDFYADPQVLSRVAQAFADNPSWEAVYGDLKYVDTETPQKVVRYWKAGDYEPHAWRWGWMPPHPTFFVKRAVYERLGGFNENLRIAADYEFMLRACHIHQISLGYIPEVLVHMRVGGLSNNTWKNRLLANQEDRKAWVVNGLEVPIGLAFTKPFRKIKQWL